jgi:hypothetical protein
LARRMEARTPSGSSGFLATSSPERETGSKPKACQQVRRWRSASLRTLATAGLLSFQIRAVAVNTCSDFP